MSENSSANAEKWFCDRLFQKISNIHFVCIFLARLSTLEWKHAHSSNSAGLRHPVALHVGLIWNVWRLRKERFEGGWHLGLSAIKKSSSPSGHAHCKSAIVSVLIRHSIAYSLISSKWLPTYLVPVLLAHAFLNPPSWLCVVVDTQMHTSKRFSRQKMAHVHKTHAHLESWPSFYVYLIVFRFCFSSDLSLMMRQMKRVTNLSATLKMTINDKIRFVVAF